MTEDDIIEFIQDVKVLVVDDEEMLAWSIAAELKKLGAETKTAASAKTAKHLFSTFAPDVVVCDIKLPDGDGIDLLKEWHQSNPMLPVILMTAHGGVESAVSAVRHSAFDYIQKPFDMKALTSAILRASEVSQLRQKVSRYEGAIRGHEPVKILGETPAVKRLRTQLQRVAASNTDTVLVHGETGSGKELASRAIHEWSKRADRPYIEINCASIPENLLESELFGFEKGAFTDARSRKLGLFEIAKDGTIFLDEIGELPLKLQAKLLRALEYRRFKRLGGIKDIEFNARIVAATNKKLIDEVAKKNFRADLYYRLNVIPITVPSLKERKADIELLAKFFVKSIASQLKTRAPEFSEKALEKLREHSWPGNVRELKNVIHRAIVLEQVNTLQPEHLTLEEVTITPSKSASSSLDSSHLNGANGKASGHTYVLPPEGISLTQLERDLLTQALERAHYNQSKAADFLHISRHTLRYRLEKHGLISK